MSQGINLFGGRAWRPWVLAAVVFAALCLCTAFADFSTKGEPREALVAVNMLKSGNWILPIDASGDMAYKPPMFHWLVALFSLPAGHVTEFTSRLPSALALTLTLVMTAHFCAAGRGRGFGLLCAALALTSFEMLRAGTVARVDMVLTVFITGAMYALYLCRSGHCALKYMVAAVLCMSCGTLTKGPVAIVLPLGVWGLWRLLHRDNFWRISGLALLMLCASVVIPLAWYYAAWLQGGDKFLTLALEENFGRFVGTMSYESHVKPLWYNFTSLLSGLLPWSLLMLIKLPRKPVRAQFSRLLHLRRLWRGMCPAARFATVAALFVFVFYCIPKSKRSVYLLPMYPFMAYGMGCYVQMLVDSGVLSIKAFKRTMVTVAGLLAVGFGVLFPLFSKTNPDKETAQHIEAIVPAGTPIYTFVPDRFARFYIIDFYLQGRLVSLLPSGQVEPVDNLNATMMRLPAEKEFYLLSTNRYAPDRWGCTNHFGFVDWLESNSLRAELVYDSSPTHGSKSWPCPVLLKITKQ